MSIRDFMFRRLTGGRFYRGNLVLTVCLAATISTLPGWHGSGAAGLNIPAPANVTSTSGPSPGGPHSIEIPVDMQKIEALQDSFEEGHQPWRGDAIAVARVEIASTLDKNVRYEDLRVEREAELEAIVTGKGAHYWFRVHLKKLIRGRKGIWTAVRIDYDSLRRK